jgi:hypothetical protein
MPILGPLVKRAYELGRLPDIAKPKVDAYTAQKRVLKKLLRKAQYTAFGEYYGFSDILKSNDFIKSFQSKIPTFTYNTMFRKWWYRILNGEAFVPGQVVLSILSHVGTSASSKYIPVASEMIKAIRSKHPAAGRPFVICP